MLVPTLSLVVAAACVTPPQGIAPPETDSVTVRRQERMSTYVTVSVAAPESPATLAAIDAAFAELDRLEALLSEWKDASDISNLNRHAGQGPVKVSPELFEVLQFAYDAGVASDGAFDVTVQSLAGLWDFRWQTPKIPSVTDLEARLTLVGFRLLTLDKEAQTVAIANPATRVGVSGLAKGYVADRMSAVLTARGFPNHLVRCGGDIYGSGRKKSGRWTIGIRDPFATGIYATVEIENEGISTSGNYERFFIRDGVRYHHILDPKTGRPTTGLASATVIAKRALFTDSWDTATFVLGKERGLAAATRLGFDVLFIDEAHGTASTPGMAKRITVAPPDEAQ
ncbi:MAG: FAD:protein FMN transferase [Deltaproteobacteria bacterium]|nr:FAD:protein FMN transferase [Deltaproteobacteria bacterium]